eukprot:2463605-Pleurochrysis_carterae.AAC.1
MSGRVTVATNRSEPISDWYMRMSVASPAIGLPFVFDLKVLVEAVAARVHNGLVSARDGQVVKVDANTHHGGADAADNKDARVRAALNKAVCKMPVAQLEIPATATLLESVDPLVELADHLLAMGTVKARVPFGAVRNGQVHQFLEEGLQLSSYKIHGGWARPAYKAPRQPSGRAMTRSVALGGRVGVVNAVTLREALGAATGFVP